MKIQLQEININGAKLQSSMYLNRIIIGINSRTIYFGFD